MKDQIIEAVTERIKTPFLGYALLAFVAFNWEAFFYLALTTGEPSIKLAAFHAATNPKRLYLYPPIIGLASALVVPIIKLALDWLLAWPRRKLSSIAEQDHSHTLHIRSKFAADRAALAEADAQIAEAETRKQKAMIDKQAAQEDEHIRRAKVDKKLDLDGDSQLKEIIEKSRNQCASIPDLNEVERPMYILFTLLENLNLSGGAADIMQAIINPNSPNDLGIVISDKSSIGKVVFKFKDGQSLIGSQREIQTFISQKFIEPTDDPYSFLLTTSGTELAYQIDELVKKHLKSIKA